MQGIHIEKLNMFHWILFMKRKDLFNLIFENFFKPPDEENEESSIDENAKQKLIKPSLQYLQHCIYGKPDSFYDIEYYKNHKLKKDSP